MEPEPAPRPFHRVRRRSQGGVGAEADAAARQHDEGQPVRDPLVLDRDVHLGKVPAERRGQPRVRQDAELRGEPARLPSAAENGMELTGDRPSGRRSGRSRETPEASPAAARADVPMKPLAPFLGAAVRPKPRDPRG